MNGKPERDSQATDCMPYRQKESASSSPVMQHVTPALQQVVPLFMSAVTISHWVCETMHAIALIWRNAPGRSRRYILFVGPFLNVEIILR